MYLEVKIRYYVLWLLIMVSTNLTAQWRLGVTIGGTYNHYSIDTHYMENLEYNGLCGGTAGLTGQYDIKEWLGIRIELNWAMKNHSQHFVYNNQYTSSNYDTYNNYIQIPLMATLSFGNFKIRGFANLGGYGAYWLSSYLSGYYGIYGLSYGIRLMNNERYSFNDQYDQRYDLGLAGGLGGEWRLSRHLLLQMECRCYYSLKSMTKDYMRIKDPSYNTTYALQIALCYYLIKNK